MTISLQSSKKYYCPGNNLSILLTVNESSSGTLSFPISSLMNNTFNPMGTGTTFISWTITVTTVGSPNSGTVSDNNDINTSVSTGIGESIVYNINALVRENITGNIMLSATLDSETVNYTILDNPYLLSEPCLWTDNNITTSTGVKNIVDIVPGDLVKTDNGTFVPVIRNYCFPLMRDTDIVEFSTNCLGSTPTQTTTVTHLHPIKGFGMTKEAFKFVNTTTITRYMKNITMVFQLHIDADCISCFVESNGMYVEAWGTRHLGTKFY